MGSRSTRVVAFWLLLGCYVALTCCVLFRSPVLSLDELIAGLHLKMHHPGLRPWIGGYVTLGQRGPTTLAALPFVGWLAWRQRSKRPLVLLATALVLLNVSVGVVKYAVGRVGPLHVADVDVHRIFAGGDIYRPAMSRTPSCSTECSPGWRRGCAGRPARWLSCCRSRSG